MVERRLQPFSRVDILSTTEQISIIHVYPQNSGLLTRGEVSGALSELFRAGSGLWGKTPVYMNNTAGVSSGCSRPLFSPLRFQTAPFTPNLNTSFTQTGRKNTTRSFIRRIRVNSVYRCSGDEDISLLLQAVAVASVEGGSSLAPRPYQIPR